MSKIDELKKRCIDIEKRISLRLRRSNAHKPADAPGKDDVVRSGRAEIQKAREQLAAPASKVRRNDAPVRALLRQEGFDIAVAAYEKLLRELEDGYGVLNAEAKKDLEMLINIRNDRDLRMEVSFRYLQSIYDHIDRHEECRADFEPMGWDRKIHGDHPGCDEALMIVQAREDALLEKIDAIKKAAPCGYFSRTLVNCNLPEDEHPVKLMEDAEYHDYEMPSWLSTILESMRRSHV